MNASSFFKRSASVVFSFSEIAGAGVAGVAGVAGTVGFGV